MMAFIFPILSLANGGDQMVIENKYLINLSRSLYSESRHKNFFFGIICGYFKKINLFKKTLWREFASQDLAMPQKENLFANKTT